MFQFLFELFFTLSKTELLNILYSLMSVCVKTSMKQMRVRSSWLENIQCQKIEFLKVLNKFQTHKDHKE